MARESAPEKKKGNRSWKPSKMLQVLGKKAGFVYRWCDKDAARLQLHQSNGWITASEISGHKTEHTATDKSEQTSITEYRELVLHAMPAEEYEEHREFYRDQNEQGLRALRRQLDEQLEKVKPGLSGKLSGKIIIE